MSDYTTPTPPPMPNAMEKNPGALAFSFKGRSNRARYWGGSILVGLISGIISTVVFAVSGASMIDANGDINIGALGGLLALIVPLGIVLWIWILSMQVRRLHDHDKSGWFVVAFWAVQFIPVVSFLAWLWPFIWLGCMKGTTGPNKYGPDPLQE